MTEEKKDKTAITIAIIAVLLSLGVPIADRTFGDVFVNELKDYYICSVDNNIMQFKGGISGTAYSGYPYVDSRKGAVTCGTTENKGSWILLSKYAQDLGIDPYDLLETQPKLGVSVEGTKWLCSVESCRRIE